MTANVTDDDLAECPDCVQSMPLCALCLYDLAVEEYERLPSYKILGIDLRDVLEELVRIRTARALDDLVYDRALKSMAKH